TALRLGVRVTERVREINPAAKICLYGLYAALNADYLLEHGADFCIGGECEGPLVALAEALESEFTTQHSALSTQHLALPGVIQRGQPAQPSPQRLPFAGPSPMSLPTREKYARREHTGARRVVGYVEASRGCLHLCTHCPIPPVYGGRFFVLPQDVVLEDVRRQVAAGATHITFGDPDFLNGPGHSLAVARAVHAEFPDLTFDVTTKIEHIVKRGAVLPELARLGCLFLISAVESVSNHVLAILEKNHTRDDIATALGIVRAAGIGMRPTWVPFTPWTGLGDYLDLLAFVEEMDLIDYVDPVQYTIRLLVPPGSYLADRPEMKPHLGPLNEAAFSYTWTHPDPRMDRLQKQVGALVEKDVQAGEDAAATFYPVWSLAAEREDLAGSPPADRGRAPRLSEPWFC